MEKILRLLEDGEADPIVLVRLHEIVHKINELIDTLNELVDRFKILDAYDTCGCCNVHPNNAPTSDIKEVLEREEAREEECICNMPLTKCAHHAELERNAGRQELVNKLIGRYLDEEFKIDGANPALIKMHLLEVADLLRSFAKELGRL